ncbi:hypothetical protein REPUB_Repub18cG0068100 [Reevesia pubescens]
MDPHGVERLCEGNSHGRAKLVEAGAASAVVRIEVLKTIALKLENLETLDLSGNYLDNSIILSISQLSYFKSLNLANNQFRGWRHNNDFSSLSRLSNLETLDLSKNQLQNSILSNLGGLSSLKTLILRQTGLKGTIAIGNLINLINLKELDLSNNAIESLEYLQELEGLSNLGELDMSRNEVTHFVASPPGNRSLSQIRVLYLDGVFTNGSISLFQLVETFSSVKTFFLRGNYYFDATFNVSQDIHLLNNVENIFLDYSTLNSNILQSIEVLTSLKTLSLLDCGLNGTLPAQGWCNVKNLEELDLSRNELQGILPSCVSNLTSLRLLDISDNQLTGNLAFTPISLRYLSLSTNRFQVPISFSTFANHSNLEVLLNDNNRVVMEPTFQTWTPKFQLKVFSLSNCSTKDLPSFLYHQANLRYLDLSHNNFGGLMFPSWLLENNAGL